MIKSSPIDQTQTIVRKTHQSLKPPSRLIEGIYFILLLNMYVGPAYGLVIPAGGSVLFAGLAVLCLMHFGSRVIGAFRPIKFALACGISFLLIQVVIYEEPLLNAWLKSFLTWIVSLIIIQSLSFRKGFLHRFALVAFLIVLATLPFLKFSVISEEMVRMGAQEGLLANANSFGMWVGCCIIYFVIAGFEAKNNIIRMAFWSAGIFCLYLMALTVSRGALLGVVIAIVIAFKKVFKRSFVPILGFLFLGWFVYVSGVFDDLIGYYVHRGAEESGRSDLWVWAFTRFLDSWWIGVGLTNTLSYAGPDGGFGPHNSLLFFGLSSGVISLALWIAYLTQATQGAFRATILKTRDSPFILPLVSFGLLNIMLGDGRFMSPWLTVIFCAGASWYYYSPRVPTMGRKAKRNTES